MKKVVIALALMAGLVQNAAGKTGSTSMLKTAKDSVSYAIGLNAGRSFRQNIAQFPNGQNVDIDLLVKAFQQALKNDTTNLDMSFKQGNELLKTYMDKYEKDKKDKEESAYIASKSKNDQYLENKIKNEGYDEMLNAPCKDCHGTLIKKLKATEGDLVSDTDYVCMNYTAKLIDGTVFDKSEDGAAVLPVDGVIDGLIDALVLMHKGEKASIIVPSELGYGKEAMGEGTIPANSILIFDVEILNVFHSDEEVDNYLISIGAGSDNED